MFPRDAPRLELRALVIIKHPRGRFDSELVVSTVEIINKNTSETAVFVDPASIVGFNPQPKPPGE